MPIPFLEEHSLKTLLLFICYLEPKFIYKGSYVCFFLPIFGLIFLSFLFPNPTSPSLYRLQITATLSGRSWSVRCAGHHLWRGCEIGNWCWPKCYFSQVNQNMCIFPEKGWKLKSRRHVKPLKNLNILAFTPSLQFIPPCCIFTPPLVFSKLIILHKGENLKFLDFEQYSNISDFSSTKTNYSRCLTE